MKKCVNCGKRYDDDYSFCSQCGGNLKIIEEKKKNTVNICPRCGAENPQNTSFCGICGKQFKKKKRSVLALIIIFSLLSVIVVAAGLILNTLFEPKELLINSGDPIHIYVGEEMDLIVSGDGLSSSDYDEIEWSVLDSEVLEINDGRITALYDSDLFWEDSYPTEVYATIKKGMRTWNGEERVYVKLKPQEVDNGQFFKEPTGSKSSSLTVSISGTSSYFFYLESVSDEDNDLSFIVLPGEITVEVPKDDYIIYYAYGDVWYGLDYYFGPDTVFQEVDDVHDFSKYTYTLKMNVSEGEGNLSESTIGENDFPQ